MEDLMVSVYCITYNHEQYIESAIKGFLMQKTNFRYEVWIHDDCSTDGTANIVREYEKKYPDIVHGIYQPKNLNKGIDKFMFPHMTGKYVAVCEGDDCWIDENKLQKQVDILEKNSEYSACVHQTLTLNCLTKEEGLVSSKKDSGLIDIEDVFIAANHAFQMSSLVCKKELFVDKPDFAVKRPGSHSLSIHLALSGPIYYINETMSLYRLFSCKDSWTYKNMNNSNMINAFKLGIIMLNDINEYTNGKYDTIIKKCINEENFKIDELNENKSLFFNPQYKMARKRRGFIYMLKLFIRISFPKTYRNLKIIKNKNF